MKICPKCHKEVEDSLEICWNYNYSFPNDKILDMTPVEESDDSGRSTDCPYCQARMVHSGKYEFHEGMNTGTSGNLFELFQNREAFDLYVCPKCGKVGFFAPLDREREFKVEQTGNGESVYKSRH